MQWVRYLQTRACAHGQWFLCDDFQWLVLIVHNEEWKHLQQSQSNKGAGATDNTGLIRLKQPTVLFMHVDFLAGFNMFQYL